MMLLPPIGHKTHKDFMTPLLVKGLLWWNNLNFPALFKKIQVVKIPDAAQLGIPGYFVHFFIEVKLAYDLEESLLKLFFIFDHAI